MGWIIYNSQGEPLVTQEQHDHTSADASGPMTDDEHDGFSEYDEIAAPGAGAANKLRLYAEDVSGVTSLAAKNSAGDDSLMSHPPRARATRDTAQSVAPGSFVKIQYATQVYDTHAAYDPTTDYDFTAPIGGAYFISGQVVIAFGSGSLDSIIAIFVNGVDAGRGSHLEVAAGITITLVVNDVLVLALNDTVDIRVQHASSGSENVIGAVTTNHFTVCYLGA
ncbi:hypothetical protein LCGC14_1223610 [marine sediment metagenome]|uniref:C1q domain-containing protein n=1 Tax=marine sediment metagenome TaxID=412755 RepID=A0A0F9LAM6_9ZZZZ